MTPNEQSQVDLAINAFDFDWAHQIAIVMDWRWANGHRPSKEMIKEAARALAEEAITEFRPSLENYVTHEKRLVAEVDECGNLTLYMMVTGARVTSSLRVTRRV